MMEPGATLNHHTFTRHISENTCRFGDIGDGNLEIETDFLISCAVTVELCFQYGDRCWKY
jgi:hypothetical protein